MNTTALLKTILTLVVGVTVVALFTVLPLISMTAYTWLMGAVVIVCIIVSLVVLGMYLYECYDDVPEREKERERERVLQEKMALGRMYLDKTKKD